MPIYEYRCTECDERFEIEQSIKDDTLTTLAGDDHEHQLKKVFHPVGISFKGQGFYKNDARSKSSSGSSSTTSSTSASSTDSSTSSDSSNSATSSSTSSTSSSDTSPSSSTTSAD